MLPSCIGSGWETEGEHYEKQVQMFEHTAA